MELKNKIFSPSNNKENGLTLGFMLSVLFCSKINEIDRQITYILHIGNFLNLRIIQRDILTNEYLLNKIFDLSGDKKMIKKKDLRDLTGLNDRTTFNKYFDNHIKNCGLAKIRVFTLSETFQILQFWQGDDKWGRMEAFKKSELVELFMSRNYENLELTMTNRIIESDNYFHHDYVKPADVKKLAKEFIKEGNDSVQSFYDEEFSSDCLSFFFLLFLGYSFLANGDKSILKV